MRVAILTVSDACARGERTDGSGDALAAWAGARGHAVSVRATVPDESARIAATLAVWCDEDHAELVLSTGGTGLSPRDVTPEATRAVLDREAPGIAERLRAAVADRVPRAALSRGVAGVRARTLIVNLPGSTGGVRDGLAVLDPLVEHAVAILRDVATDHSSGGAA
jgi:molybdenum cofactor biosynthesis protein B